MTTLYIPDEVPWCGGFLGSAWMSTLLAWVLIAWIAGPAVGVFIAWGSDE